MLRPLDGDMEVWEGATEVFSCIRALVEGGIKIPSREIRDVDAEIGMRLSSHHHQADEK